MFRLVDIGGLSIGGGLWVAYYISFSISIYVCNIYIYTYIYRFMYVHIISILKLGTVLEHKRIQYHY